MAVSEEIQNKVLVVDDESLIRWSVRERLQEHGLLVVEAHDGSSALQIINCQAISAVLLDLRLPDTSGLEVLKAVRELHPYCRVWIMTAYRTRVTEDEARELGVRAFVHKPFDIDSLAKIVVSALAEPDAAT